jgi:hypothetical protein
MGIIQPTFRDQTCLKITDASELITYRDISPSSFTLDGLENMHGKEKDSTGEKNFSEADFDISIYDLKV